MDITPCRATYVTGSMVDPYGTDCDLRAGHQGPHQGEDPLIEGKRIAWNGGRVIAGDRTPSVRIASIHPARRAPRA